MILTTIEIHIFMTNKCNLFLNKKQKRKDIFHVPPIKLLKRTTKVLKSQNNRTNYPSFQYRDNIGDI